MVGLSPRGGSAGRRFRLASGSDANACRTAPLRRLVAVLPDPLRQVWDIALRRRAVPQTLKRICKAGGDDVRAASAEKFLAIDPVQRVMLV